MADYTMTWVLLALYLVGLLALLVFVVSQNLRGQIQGAVERHYLADRSLGGLTLGLTAIASIFSGYTVTGLPAEAWRTGFSALRWYGYGPTIVLTFVALAPRLRHLASRRGYVSVLDLVRDRYCKGGVDPLGRLLHALATCTFLVPCAIYLLVQFISFSANINVLAKGEWPAWLPGLFLFLLLVVFETAGGLKAVVLTDVVQGGVLAVAALAWIFIQGEVFGGMQSATAALVEEKPSLVDAPPAASMGGWLNAWVLVGVGRVMFPDLMTRMAAARSQSTLRTSAIVIVCVDLVVYLVVALIGLHGRALHPQCPLASANVTAPAGCLAATKSNAIFTMVMLDVVDSGWAGALFGSLMIAASTAAIMSTADSVLMEVAKLAAFDVCRPLLEAVGRPLSDQGLLRVGRASTFVVAGVCWVLTATEALTMADLSETLALQSIFCVALFPMYFWGMYSDSVPTPVAIASVVFGVVGGVLAWVYKTNPDTLVGEPEPILPLVVLLVNFVAVGLAGFGLRHATGGQLWATWERELTVRDAAAGGAAKEALHQPMFARPGAVAPLKEPIHYWPALLAAAVAIALALPFGGNDSNVTWGMPDWSLVYIFRIVAIMLGLAGIACLCWEEAPGAPSGGDSEEQSEGASGELKAAMPPAQGEAACIMHI